MKRIYLILGNGGSCKSQLIRHLTGLFNSGFTTIRLLNNQEINISVWIRAIQEWEMSIEDMLREVAAVDKVYFLMALHINDNGNHYLNALIEAGHIFEQIVLLNTDYIDFEFPVGININTINNTNENASNYNASLVREWWNWY